MLTKQDAKMAQGLAIISMLMLHLFCRVDNLPYEVHFLSGGAHLLFTILAYSEICASRFTAFAAVMRSALYRKKKTDITLSGVFVEFLNSYLIFG